MDTATKEPITDLSNREPATQPALKWCSLYGAGIGSFSGAVAGTCIYPVLITAFGALVGLSFGLVGGVLLGLLLGGPERGKKITQHDGKVDGAIIGTVIPPTFALFLTAIEGSSEWMVVGLVISIPSSLGLAWAGAATVRRVEAARSRNPAGYPYRPDRNLFWWCIGTSAAIPLSSWLAVWLWHVV